MHVLIVDDHWVSRAGVRQLLSLLDEDITLSEASGAEEALEIVARERDLNLILLDLVMPGMDPFDGLRALHRECPDVPIVVFSVNEQRKDVLRTIDLGAMGYIPKSSDAEEILSALKQVLAGSMYLPRGLMNKPDQAGTSGDLEPDNLEGYRDLSNSLTKRQLEVFHLLAKGLSNREIAGALDVSEHTVRIHISAILRTLKVANRTQAALIAAASLANR
jgi:DNA-binding NarL/FixJ family response regulator